MRGRSLISLSRAILGKRHTCDRKVVMGFSEKIIGRVLSLWIDSEECVAQFNAYVLVISIVVRLNSFLISTNNRGSRRPAVLFPYLGNGTNKKVCHISKISNGATPIKGLRSWEAARRYWASVCDGAEGAIPEGNIQKSFISSRQDKRLRGFIRARKGSMTRSG